MRGEGGGVKNKGRNIKSISRARDMCFCLYSVQPSLELGFDTSAAMSTDRQSSSSNPAQASKHQGDVENFKQLCAQIGKFSSADSFKRAVKVIDETDALQGQLEAKDEELAKTKRDMKEEENKNKIAIEKVLEANRKENGKTNEGLLQVQSLEASIQEKETTIAQQNKGLNNLKSQLQKLQTAYDAEKATVAQAHRDIDSLQQSEKAKDATIDKIKAGRLKTKQILSEKENKARELEDENLKLRESVQVVQTRLSKLEGLTAGYHEGDEKAM